MVSVNFRYLFLVWFHPFLPKIDDMWLLNSQYKFELSNFIVLIVYVLHLSYKYEILLSLFSFQAC